ncbi:histidine kinase [soil metagenome]
MSSARLVSLVNDFLAPLVLTGITVHELLYNAASWPTWLLTMVLIWALAFRRRFPILVYALCLVIVLVLCVLGIDSAAFAALIIAVYSVAAHRDFRYAVICTIVLELGVVLVSQRFAPQGSIDDAVVLLTGVSAAALFAGTTLRSNRRYLSTVEDRAERLELEQAQQAELAALAERARIAREMHDIVAHGLSVVITLAEGAAATAESDPARSRAVMQQVAAGGRQSLAEMRKLLDVLRADDSVDHFPQPDLDALEVLLDDVRRTGLNVKLSVTGDPDGVGSSAQATVYRIVQESLTNVIKHAINASTVTVDLDFGSSARFRIQDDGAQRRRIDSGNTHSGNGIAGMRERVAIFDGMLETGPTEAGWLVSGELGLR